MHILAYKCIFRVSMHINAYFLGMSMSEYFVKMPLSFPVFNQMSLFSFISTLKNLDYYT